MTEILIKKLSKEVPLPKYETDGSSGLDLAAHIDKNIEIKQYKIKASDIGLREAEQQSLHFFQTHIKQHKSPLCGSSVSHDRRFLIKHMPKLANHFHYRHIDVSSFKEVIKRWSPDADEFKKESSHRAMDDIKDSVNELKFYREKFFK